MSEYLYINQPKLVLKEFNILKKLEELILSGNTIRLDRNINQQTKIRSKTLQK